MFRTENLNQILVQDLRPPIQWDLRHQKLWGLHVLHGHTVVKSLTALSSIPVVKIYLDTTTQNIATSKSQSSCTSGSRSKMRSQKSSAHTASSSSHKTLTGDTFCRFYVGVHLYNWYLPNLKFTKSYGYLKSGFRHFITLTGDTICRYFYVGVHLYNLYQPNLKLTK